MTVLAFSRDHLHGIDWQIIFVMIFHISVVTIAVKVEAGDLSHVIYKPRCIFWKIVISVLTIVHSKGERLEIQKPHKSVGI